MARSAPSSAEKRNKVPTGRTVVRPVLRLERTGASSLCAQGRKQELEMIRGRRCPVSTGRGRPVCRPAVRPAPGAHAGAPLPVSVGSGGKRGEVPPQGGGEGPLSHGDNLPAPPEGEPNPMRQITHHVIARSEATRQSASPFGASRTVEKENGFPRQGYALPRNDRAIKPFLISPDSRGARHNSRTMGWHFRWISAMIGADHRPVR